MLEKHERRVAVIGGGVAGLVSAKVLKQDEFDITVFEKEPTMGGVWAASRAYPGLRTNNPRETYAFSDFPYPETVDEFPTAGQVREYLKSYVEHFGLGPHLRLSTEVVSVSRRAPDGQGRKSRFRVTVRPTQDPAAAETCDFDFVVVCNGVFSEPDMPQFDGEEHFTGSVLHSSQILEPKALSGKRVIVVGAGKSGLDCATFAGREAASCTPVFRRPHWMLPRYFGRTRVDRMMFTRLSELTLPAYHRVPQIEIVLRRLGAPLLWLYRRMISRLVVRLVGIPDDMVPDRSPHSGAENIGIGEAFYQVLRQGLVQARRTQNVSFAGKDRVQLDSGEQLPADIVICATGWCQNLAFLDAGLRQEIEVNGRFQLYRHILPPQEQHLGFVGYASSANCPLLSELAAHWLSQCFRGELALPSANEMAEEIERVLQWTREVFPKRPEGYFIGAFVAHYADDLLRDMGLRTRRTESLLSEYLMPLWADRYKGLTKERRLARGGER
jgi:dimethylaniline monooxygenase (N-oxide forming)